MRNSAILIALLAVACLALACTGQGGGSSDECVQDQDEHLVRKPRDSNPRYFLVLNDLLFFQASSKGYDLRLWTHDGRGTPDKIDRLEGPRVFARGQPAEFDGQYYFPGHGPTSEVWKTSRVLARPVQEGGYSRTYPSEPRYLTSFDGELYFAGRLWQAPHELFKINTAGDATRVGENVLGPAHPDGSFPTRLTALNDRLLFNADGSELWEHDGVATRRLASDMDLLHSLIYEDLFYFVGDGTSLNGSGLYTYDGTGLPIEVADLVVTGLMIYESLIHLVTTDGSITTLRSWDGTGEMIEIFDSPPDGVIEMVSVLDGALFFVLDEQMWRYDGVGSPVSILPWPHTSNPGYVAVYKDVMYFPGKDHRGVELWTFDGRDAEREADLDPGTKCLPEDG